ncbi:MAG: hypothetical protein WCY62_01060 [Clostridia bacterium]|jgi:hypothetical protein
MNELTGSDRKRGFGISEIIGIAVVLLIAAIIVIPGLKNISLDIMTKLRTWVDGILPQIFDASPTPAFQ